MQARRIITFEWDSARVVNFENPFSDIVQEITIMRYNDDGPRILAQGAFQPLNSFSVEMVSWFVQQK